MNAAPKPRDSGFALIVAILLLAFLALLLLSLTTLMRIDSGSAGNLRKQAEARQNALLALDLAVGHLQRTAGPDGRVTANAEALGLAHPHYTGVWDAAADSAAPLTWLVSGNEGRDPMAVTPANSSGDAVELVGRQTSGRTADVMVPRQSVVDPSRPGTSRAVAGHYAWWIGDQGIKAPVALRDDTSAIDYVPYDSARRQRLPGQQIGRGPGVPDFEVSDGENAAKIRGLAAFNQIAFLRKPDGTALGVAALREHYHDWSPDNLAVLAATRPGGLRRDLSVAPGLLGGAFAAWADYRAYLEDPSAPAPPPPSPAYAGDPLRRRHRLTPPAEAGGITHGVWPILTYFLLTFNVRTQSGSSATKPLEVRARWMFTLWNPYTSALVPENLRMEITGLPAALQVVDETAGSVAATISLPAAYGSPLRISLPWDASVPDADRQSWLPGRVYTWTALEDLSGVPPPAGRASRFYSRNLSADAGQGVTQGIPGTAVDGDHVCHLSVTAAQELAARLWVVRPGGDLALATFHSPAFAGFTTTPHKVSSGTYQFSYLFRLAESLDTPAAPGAWLQDSAGDLRRSDLGADAFVTGPNGNRPELYENYATISAPDRLCDRAANGVSYNEDAPLFELPRAPLLSLGELQHLALAGLPPFSIGHPRSGTAVLGGIPALELFDRFYFSGLAAGVDWSPGKPLPNPRLQLPAHKSDGSAVSRADLAAADGSGGARYLLQGGAFNLNSVSRDAWAAVLRSVRFPGTTSFDYLDAAASTGTGGDGSVRVAAVTAAQFFRFPQSAPETGKADDPWGSSTYAASTTVPPAPPSTPSLANTQLFRRGFRSLSPAQVERLAESIVALNRERQMTAGPWRTLAGFLGPDPAYADENGRPTSLLERAIATAGLNGSIPEFSSQWLTQADILTALAPVLFTRSDTFVIRTYGDVSNPVTSAVEGRAWAEAVVQRTPVYVDPADPEDMSPPMLRPLNSALGRRFRIVDFRWLTAADI
ncbi:MAG TPA: hypothetical protein VG838_15870 [Opitutaceae bacterium]|nr:hypothetical protein [Opitutaceae bacterium]